MRTFVYDTRSAPSIAGQGNNSVIQWVPCRSRRLSLSHVRTCSATARRRSSPIRSRYTLAMSSRECPMMASTATWSRDSPPMVSKVCRKAIECVPPAGQPSLLSNCPMASVTRSARDTCASSSMSVASRSAGFPRVHTHRCPAGVRNTRSASALSRASGRTLSAALIALTGLRPERAASRDPRLGPRVVAPAAFQVQVLTVRVRHVGVAETAVDAQQDHGFQGYRRRCQHGPDLGRLEHALPILLPFTAQLAPARADEARPKPDRLVDQVGLVGVPENAADPLDLHLAGQLAVGLGDLGA